MNTVRDINNKDKHKLVNLLRFSIVLLLSTWTVYKNNKMNSNSKHKVFYINGVYSDLFWKVKRDGYT